MKPVRGSRTGRPIMVLFDLLGRRWTLRVLWELREGAVGFRALQLRCDDVSPTSLSQRLRELREAGVVEDSAEGLRLTAEGRALLHALAPLSRWAERWAERQRD
jgi:DNA-binding HxlR family transcriptional regulator